MSTVILAQLVALRAQLEATIALVEATVRPEPARVPVEPGCPHPPERQAGFGDPAAPMLMCLDCGFKRPDVVKG
jgi:hypothetical protein